MPSQDFTVLIAGGGIAGLTLANLLERVGINYVILEGYREMAPQVGASIGILPNGSRVLDQIGLYDQIRKLIDEPLSKTSLRDANGNATSQYHGSGEQMKRRHGYDTVFVDRQMVLNELWKNLKNKDKVLVSKKVTRVSLEPSKVSVVTSDGQSYSGDILVGADGIHSCVRSEMWRLADRMEPGYIPASEKKECLPTVYKCIFGISIIKDWEDGALQTNFNKHFSYLVIAGPSDRVYWFLFVNMGYTHYGPELPHFTKEDELKLVKEHEDDKIKGTFTFKDLYATKISSVLTPLPEYVFKKWHFNRIMTIGDAAHKLEPISGQGGNSAIETAAVLVTNLTQALKQNPAGVTTEQIHNVFLETQKKREPRVWSLVRASHQEQRFAAMENPLLALASRYVVPNLSYDDKQGPWSTNIEGGHQLELLDVPKRPRAIPFLDELPTQRLTSSGLPKLVVGAALAGMLFLAQRVLVIPPDEASGASFVGQPLKTEYTGNSQIDSVLSLLGWAFSEATSGPEPNARLQCLYFLINLVPIIYIWTVEGYRNGNQLSLVSWPSFFAVYQLVGIGKIAPLYFLISLHTTSSEIYTRPTGRPIPSTVAKALVPALCLGYILPTALMFIQYGDSVVQQNAIAFWQPSPVYVALLTWVFSGLLGLVSPIKSLDWEIFENKDQGALQTGYTLTFAITAITHVCALAYARLSPSVSLLAAFFDLPDAASMGLGHSIGGFWRYDMLLCFGAVAVWCLYTVYELRRLGYISTRAAIGAAAATLMGQVLVGPGATYSGLWAWRENVIVGLMKC